MNDTGAALSPIDTSFKKYIHEVLGISPSLQPWTASAELPFFLRQAYELFSADILDVPVLLAMDSESEFPSPLTIAKHLQEIEKHSCKPVIYVRDQLASFQRKRLVDQKIPFVVPGNQMYLPMLAIDLREHFRQLRKVSPTFSPATQATVLQLLLRPTSEDLTSQNLAKQLGYTKMTMSRSFNELEASGFVQIEYRGRERHLIAPENRRLLWTNVQTFVQSPIKTIHHVSKLQQTSKSLRQMGTIAGMSALAHCSMLADPATPVVAMTSKIWKRLFETEPPVAMSPPDPDAITVEIWTYDPTLFAKDNIVDRLSLYLSLKESVDERVQMALDELMEKMPW